MMTFRWLSLNSGTDNRFWWGFAEYFYYIAAAMNHPVGRGGHVGRVRGYSEDSGYFAQDTKASATLLELRIKAVDLIFRIILPITTYRLGYSFVGENNQCVEQCG